MPFEIIWYERHPWRQRPGKTLTEAVLLERKLIGDRPMTQVVCRIAAIDANRINDPGEVDRFWHRVDKRLGRMFRLTARDRDEIETLIARTVPRPSAQTASTSTAWRSYPITGPHQPVILRTR
jgi:hypothetical protein